MPALLTAEKPAACLSLSGLSASYDGVGILSDVDLALAQGEVLALLGRNGAGKTTLISSILNLEPTVGGRVSVKGHDVTGWPTHRIARLGLALVPQGRGVFPNLTVEENLRMAMLWTRGAPDRRWTLERAYEVFPRLAERRRSSSGALSGGERQLLAIARALLTQADFIILDEPSEGLAPLAIEDVIIGSVGRLAREGLTMVIAEQNVAMALRLATRAVVLAHGRIVFDGAPATLLADTDLQREHLGL
ncbi:ABC transporter ATP-binding protein [Phreatobacter stygius]|uniref:ABC transporter ATP-binding protein n=1 Tax=Phreatobacter stygius TaxID=1940610 RepID=A0A4D7B8K2_9HYPH|nr:ABC transporter ATP-binding protein [Phreatobacter stygius]QCI67173.1 ABC transporter ATP-binding protein [Phreatobacter stygius]